LGLQNRCRLPNPIHPLIGRSLAAACNHAFKRYRGPDKRTNADPEAWLAQGFAQIADRKIARLDEIMPSHHAARAA